MKKWLAGIGLVAVLATSASAWRPAGWVYNDYPWAYDSLSGDWYWFNTPNSQWVVRMSNGQWAKLQNSAIASGWVYYHGSFAYAQGNEAWHWINEPDVQWVVNMRTTSWTRFGIPPGMARISGGANSGSNLLANGESYILDWFPQTYTLSLDTFYMDKYEVTKTLWNTVTNWNNGNSYLYESAGPAKSTNHPVHSVNWYDCVKWCNARSQMEGRTPVYYTNASFTAVYKTGRVNNVYVDSNANGYRLATSDQWEYAARGGAVSHRYPWSDSNTIQHVRANYMSSVTNAYDTSPTRGYHPTYSSGSFPYTSPAGSFAANGFGLYDMAGNVWEWCFDWHPSYIGTARVIRGGSWDQAADYGRVGYRSAGYPNYADNSDGFRTVLLP